MVEDMGCRSGWVNGEGRVLGKERRYDRSVSGEIGFDVILNSLHAIFVHLYRSFWHGVCSRGEFHGLI